MKFHISPAAFLHELISLAGRCACVLCHFRAFASLAQFQFYALPAFLLKFHLLIFSLAEKETRETLFLKLVNGKIRLS